MAVDSTTIANLVIGGVLGYLAVLLLVAGLRRRESILLATFLGLVGMNYLAVAVGEAQGSLAWIQVAHVALALDPPLLLFFVARFPYWRRGRGLAVATWAALGSGALLAVAAVVVPEATVVARWDYAAVRRLPRLLLIGQMAVVYLACWLLAARAAQKAPTPQLARRAAWGVVAVGIAVLPRLGGLHADFNLTLVGRAHQYPSEAMHIAALEATALAIALILLALGRAVNRDADARSFRLTGWMLMGLQGLVFLQRVIDVYAGGALGAHVWSIGGRWLVFAAILVYGLLSYEVLELSWPADRLTSAGGALVGGAVVSGVFVSYGAQSGMPLLLLVITAMVVASGAAVVLGNGVRRLTQGLRPRAALMRQGPPAGHDARRLELYRAALEAAWVGGPPDESRRRQLDRDRKAFRITEDEARALEHVVASTALAGGPGLRSGEEPLPGLVIERLLGEGAQGRVHLARYHTSGQHVVIKELRTDRLGLESSRRSLFAESRALEALEHPNIVRLLGVHVIGGHHLLVFEHVDGVPLSERIHGRTLDDALTKHVVGQLLDALEVAHARGVVHRDIKPSNVLVRADGHAWLTDFGTAAASGGSGDLKATATRLDGLGELQGTLAYLAPELVAGAKASTASDIYGVGLVLYECVVGRPALDLTGRSILAALDVVGRPRIDLGRVPRHWRATVQIALDQDPARRFASAWSMRTAVMATQPR